MTRLLCVISGGQTGVDRGALDAALDLGVRCGGWCPAGRQAEDGVIPARYPLTELSGAGYDERTLKNVEDSDGTLIVTFGPADGGTARTVEFCRQLGRRHLIVDAACTPLAEAAHQAVRFAASRAGTSMPIRWCASCVCGVPNLRPAGPRPRFRRTPRRNAREPGVGR
jgi:hypothetical protein